MGSGGQSTFFGGVVVQEELCKVSDSQLPQLLLKGVQGNGVRHALHQSAVYPRADDLVGGQTDFKSRGLEDLVELRDELHRELLLSQIAALFHDHFGESPRLQIPERRVRPHPTALFRVALAKGVVLLQQSTLQTRTRRECQLARLLGRRGLRHLARVFGRRVVPRFFQLDLPV